MPGCAAIGCNNRSEKGYTMKCFPRDRALRKIWKERVGRADWEPSNNSFLCHVHFEPSQWVVTPSGRIKLKKGALPSIFTVTSTRKSPKKKQKLGIQPIEEDDLEDCELEYLENDGPIIFNMGHQKLVPNIITAPTQNTSTSGHTFNVKNFNVKFITSDALKDLQNENIIIVSDENNREIGKIINDNGFVLLENERGKENVETSAKSDKSKPAEVKIEIKEEVPENGLSVPDYDEIERKLQEICHSENEDSSNNNNDLSNKVNNNSTETESTFSLEDLDNSDSIKESTTQETDPDIPTSRTGMKRKRKMKILKQENSTKPSQVLNKKNETQFKNDVTDIINDLEAENPEECCLQQSKHVSSSTSVKNSMKNIKPLIKNDIQLKFKNNIINRSVKNKKNNVTNASNLKPSDELIAKVNIQGEVIERLSNQLIMYKDMERKMKTLTQNLQNKDKEIQILTHKVAKKSVERKVSRNDATDLRDASEVDLRNRIDFLEDNNKKLMKTVTLDSQNRRKLECQLKSRDNQIKELNWKLEKASKFLDRAEKNTYNYRKKMLNMQAIIRRKKLVNEANNMFDEFLIGQTTQNYSENALKMALEIEKVCGIEGYQKILNYEFPLPTLKELSKSYPGEIDYYESDEDGAISDKGGFYAHEVSLTNIKMENVEYLDPEFLEESDRTITGTVQDIFNECSDCEELNINELKKHIMINEGVTSFC